MIKYIRSYVKICDICQKTKVFRHRFYNKFDIVVTIFRSLKKISINFVTEFHLTNIKTKFTIRV